MSLLPASASFEELVQECFLALRGTGLMLSALDAQLVATWGEKAVPYEVVARGIRRAAERAIWDARPGEPLMRSLRACKSQVEAEIGRYLAHAVGRGTSTAPHGEDEGAESFDVSRHRKIRSSLRELKELRPDLAVAIERLKSGIVARPPTSHEEATQRTDWVAYVLLRALPFGERFELLREAQARLGEVRMSYRARKLALRFHRSAVLSQRFGLKALG